MSASEFTSPAEDPGEKSVFVSLSKKQSRPPTTEAQGQDEVINVVSALTEKEREEMGKRVWDLYVADVRSRADRMKKYKKFIELYASLTKKHSFPYQNVPNVNV